jgi:hypothetical protein
MSAAPARGQIVEQPEAAMLQFWQIGLTPRVNVATGIDTNVFNQAIASQEDFTSNVTGDVALSWRVGRVRLGGTGQYNYQYFREFARERSGGGAFDLRTEIPFNRLNVWAAGSYLNTKERPGLEIDERARRTNMRAAGGLQLRTFGRTSLDVDASRSTAAYDETASLQLQAALNHDTDTINLGMRYALTPLTTLRVRGEMIRDRFEFSQLRDADSVRVMGGLDLAKLALISGQAWVGFRSFSPSHPEVPPYTGLVAAVGVGYTWVTRARVTFDFNRDLNYATDPREPYYVFNDVRGALTVRLTDTWDTTVGAGRQILDYQEREFAPQSNDLIIVPGPRISRDEGLSYSGGVGFRMNPLVRVGFDARYFTRRGSLATRSFEGWRIGTSVTYGR